jgi:hypothetical protein
MVAKAEVLSERRLIEDYARHGETHGSLGEWIDAAHAYRHEEGKPDAVAQPPLSLAVYLVSTGAAHLRWVAELDAATIE